MPCYHPIHGYRSRFKSKNGKYYFTMKSSEAFLDIPMSVPCGQCIGCRLERSRIWAVRCVHEASLYEQNCFITLTYSDVFLPKERSLVLRHFQLFMKRLRRAYPGKKIRFFQCGEYGENFGRPHYHACLFNFDFMDKLLWSVRDGVNLYRSPQLEKLWGMGFCTIGDVTFESAAYVARYVTKKITGEKAFDHYRSRIDYDTGEVFMRKPEFVTMSRRPGIARDWIEKYKSDVYPDDFIVIRGNVKIRPPKYYDSIYDGIDDIKVERMVKAYKNREDNTSERLAVKEELQRIRFKKLKRGYEND